MRFFVFIVVLGVCALANADFSPSIDESKLANKISEMISRLSDELILGLIWEEESEVKEIKSYSPLKRMAAVYLVVGAMENNDGKLFPKSEKNQDQLSVMLASRYIAFRYIVGFIGGRGEEDGMRDYIESEISDLNLMFNDKIPYIFYLKSHQDRKNKLLYVYGSDEKFVEEMLSLARQENIVALANKTSALALIETCMENAKVCKRM
ncbi:hypothetical protein [Alloalcanivorax xenomutans]|uniref:hypothetical protein n=1 Tax=Alloalcanivorax xenomutans TaxID=1094342 RepID=UPI003BACE6A8